MGGWGVALYSHPAHKLVCMSDECVALRCAPPEDQSLAYPVGWCCFWVQHREASLYCYILLLWCPALGTLR